MPFNKAIEIQKEHNSSKTMSDSETEIESVEGNESQDICLFLEESPVRGSQAPGSKRKRARISTPSESEDEISESGHDVSQSSQFRDAERLIQRVSVRRSPRKHKSSHTNSTSQARPESAYLTTSTPKTVGTAAREDQASTSKGPITIKGQLAEILGNQREMMSSIKSLRKEIGSIKTQVEKRIEEEKSQVFVPNKIRNAVKDAFSDGIQREHTWNYQKRFSDEVNGEMSCFIKESVQGIHPDVTVEVLQAAMKRYFTSKKEAANRVAKNKEQSHKKRQATYERKKEKTRRRLQALEKKTNWSREKKEKVRKLLKDKNIMKYISSDEEADEGFLSHPFSWESDELKKVKESLDKKYLEVCPARSRRMLLRRTKGSVREVEAPDVQSDLRWIIK